MKDGVAPNPYFRLPGSSLLSLVEASGLEPLISCVQSRRSPSELSPLIFEGLDWTILSRFRLGQRYAGRGRVPSRRLVPRVCTAQFAAKGFGIRLLRP